MKAGNFIKKYTMVIALAVVFILFTIFTGGRLLLAQNISNLLLQNAYVLVMACGMLLCILTGGNVDLSIGSTLCLSGAIVAKLLTLNVNPILTIIIAIVAAAIIGACQGYLIGYIHVPPFICTLAGMFLFRGISRVVLDSKTVSVMNKDFLDLFTSYIQIPGIDYNQHAISALAVGIIIAIIFTIYTLISRNKKIRAGYEVGLIYGTIAKIVVFDVLVIAYTYKLMNYKGIPIMLVWILAVIVFFMIITKYTVFGRYFYAVGGNEKAAILSGIDSRKIYFFAYFIMSILAGLSGLMVAARIGSVDGNMGNTYEMDAIASCFIGGASAYGGSGSIQGIMIGAILLGVINQGMSILGLPDQFQYVVKGLVLLAAVVFDVVSNHKTGK
ncbi:MAG: sugar ABC transporter permease [Catonella sp.]|uniref:sugar ABC transporter permease n=1 Tax=Catonella sp. TaxID=2382125 RepID=UPI003FA04A14